MINLNGKLTENPVFSPYNRALLYGDAVFETIRCLNGKIIFWEDHYFRLMASMRILRMEIPMEFTMENLETEIKNTLDAEGLSNEAASVRLTVFRDEGGRYLPQKNTVSFYIFGQQLQDPFYLLNEEPYEVELYKDHYLNADMLSTLKTANKLIHVTGSIFASENGYDNCLLLNTKKSVAEALQGNLFLVKDNHIKTPPLEEGCLRGIIRKQVIDIIEKVEGIEIKEEAISPFELQKADELFITNTLMGIRPITKYRKKTYGNKISKNLLGKLNAKARLG
ncbi:aminotransferase class IV [Flavimarina sp. Hel_I_48]|uniref:aminotransferase class IV n=1 Tax=Flavimarina sp. Hel_I_48 TaxID=1392488 RepID=UPI0004DFBAF4|nr:aminotransferase class IV [Flavimarina sp. Hel_I_48]